MAIRYLDMTELEEGKPTDPIWAINTASSSEIAAAGEIHIGIPKINGSKIDPLHIPQTWLAIELTTSIPRNQLLHASEFRAAIANGLIRIVSAASAKEINSQDGASEEQARLIEMRRHIRAAGAARTLSNKVGEITMVSGAGDQSGEEPDAPKKKVELSAGFAMFAEKLTTQDDTAALNAIRARRTFSRRELLHLKKSLKDKPKTLAAVTKQLDNATKAASAAK